jgi:hypothetical protein
VNAEQARESAVRREELRARLQAQRAQIASRLGLATGSEGAYPRSATMRLITQQPELVARALGLAFSLFRRRTH